MSEELENSLFESIQTYLDQRLKAVDEQLAKLQSDFHEALAQARQNAASSPLRDTSLAAAVTGHLQTAREQKLSGAPAAPPADLSGLRRGIDELKDQRTQSDVLTVLLRNAAQFADRTVLFVVKGEQAIAWRMCDARDRSNLQAVSGVAVPLTGNSVVSEAARSHAPEKASGTRSEDSGLIDQLRGEAQQLAALPLTVRGKVVAVLYADSAWPHEAAIQMDALEVLTQVASMAVELASPRAARPAQAVAPVAEAAQPSEPEPTPTAQFEAEQPEEPAYIPQVEAQAPAEHVETVPEAAAEIEAAEMATAEHAPVIEAVVAPEAEFARAPEPQLATEPEPETPATLEPQPTAAEQTFEPSPAPEQTLEPPAAPEPAPQPPPPAAEKPSVAAVFTGDYSAPLGTRRRYGMPETDLPVEVGEEERRLHHDARRFARLLVSEIKLYNEQKVSEGRNQGDIYDRLREDIDRSRQMYDKRVAPPVAARHDYFHQELVNTLAEGDPAKLGHSYPGAVAVV